MAEGDDLKQALFLYALQNAVKHGGVPQTGAVIGMVMGARPELRSRAKEVSTLAKEAIAGVASLSPVEREEKLRQLAPDVYSGLFAKHERKKGLPDLERAADGVVMRFAPNPSGPLHIGHARAAVLNDAYVNQYGGQYILRIEDTDPKRVDHHAYSMVIKDIDWLGIRISSTVYQSDRLPLYYDLCRQLIGLGGAYVCTCDNDRFREMKMAKIACPCRSLTAEENLSRWEKMLLHEYSEGQATVRIRTDLEHTDPAMRDFPAFRILDSVAHPRKPDAFVYPLMNFSVVADDHLLGITHVIRGKDHIANTRRQRYIYEHFGWDVPVYRHYGRMGIEGVVLSTSQMRRGIQEGMYSGWDDIRLGTLRAIDRRGIRPEAVKSTMLAIGIGEVDISFSWNNLYAENKKIIDPAANRYFFVPDPVTAEVKAAAPQKARLLLHPGDTGRGIRTLDFFKTVLLPSGEITPGTDMVRLKDLFNVRIAWAGDSPSFSFAGDSLADARASGASIIQWLPAEQAVPCSLLTPDGTTRGMCEPALGNELGKNVQFERTGFVRIDSVTDSGIVAYFTHT